MSFDEVLEGIVFFGVFCILTTLLFFIFGLIIIPIAFVGCIGYLIYTGLKNRDKHRESIEKASKEFEEFEKALKDREKDFE